MQELPVVHGQRGLRCGGEVSRAAAERALGRGERGGGGVGWGGWVGG